MKLTELLLEKRRNPEASPRLSFIDQLKQINKQHTDKRLFVTFTQLPKLGANPRSQYHTPVGIYAYPIKYVISKKGDVPFAADQRYYQVFSVSPSANIWELAIDEPTRALKNKLQAATSSILKVQPSFVDYEVTTNDREVWYKMYTYIRGFTTHHIHQRAPGVIAREILRKAGFDGIVDTKGRGIIHNNERSQAVFFNLKVLQPIHIGETKYDLTYERGRGTHAPRALKHEDILKYIHNKIRLLAATHKRDRNIEQLLLQHAGEFPTGEFTRLFTAYATHSMNRRWPEAEALAVELDDINEANSIYNKYLKHFNTPQDGNAHV